VVAVVEEGILVKEVVFLEKPVVQELLLLGINFNS
tara:strand:+ start:825 stop:929 length:105 start_codon:yes stop_codon:yes gene_type:complete